MNENIKRVLLISSIALNVVFTATYATYKFPLLAEVHEPPTIRGSLFLQLDLTPEQLTRFEAERTKFHAHLQGLGQEIKTNQIELIDLLAAASPGQKEIEKKQAEIRRLQKAVQDRVIDHFLQEGSLLTPEQRVRFFELIKARIETTLQACPSWMRSFDHDRPGGRQK